VTQIQLTDSASKKFEHFRQLH